MNELDELPDQLLDVRAICDQRDELLARNQILEQLVLDAPIHHYGKTYEEWTHRRNTYFQSINHSEGSQS